MAITMDPGLTEREKEIIKLVAQAKSNKQIAAQLGIKEATARSHIYSAMKKLVCHNRVELAVMYTQGQI